MFKQYYLKAQQALLKLLGVSELPVEGKALNLSEDQKAKVTEAFGADFLKTFTDATLKFNAAEQAEAVQKEQAKKEANDAIKLLQAEIEKLAETNANQQQQIEQLAELPANDAKVIVMAGQKDAGAVVIAVKGSTNSTHLFDANKFAFKNESERQLVAEIMALDENRVWNQKAHQALLQMQGVSYAIPTAEIEYGQLATDFNKYWKLIRQDIRTLPYVTSAFDTLIPIMSGISDKAVGFNLFLDELTQAYQSNFVEKGAFRFEPETQTVRDVEVAYEFKNLKELERNWIGVITGANMTSSPIKLSFVAYLAEHMIKKIIMERDTRTANGRYKAPVPGVPGKAINGADGVYEVLNDKIAELKVRTFKLGVITDSNIHLKLRTAAEMVPKKYRDSLQLDFWVPQGFIRKYNDALNVSYGPSRPNRADIDHIDGFKNMKLKEIPYSDGRMRIFITLPGNVTRLENLPGEAFSGMRMKEEIKSIKMNSVWKEGAMFHLAGPKAASEAALEARDYDQQAIWCNEIDFDPDYFIEIEKDDATPSVADHTSLISVENTNLVTITNIDDAPVGKEIRIKAGFNNSIQITNTNNFSLLPTPWVPTQGDIIVLKKRTDGKFIELQRIDAETANAVILAANATTADGSVGEFFITSANSGATALTNITNSVPGVVYKIQGGSATNSTTIANSGNFVLSNAMTLGLGAWIELEKSASDGKFYEIRRSA